MDSLYPQLLPSVADSSTCSAISPILASKIHLSPSCLTGQRSHRSSMFRCGDNDTILTNATLDQYLLSSTILGRGRRRSYALPDVEQLCLPNSNPGCILNQNLRLLQRYLLVLIEEIAETDPLQDKKQNGFDDSSAFYRFARDCFLVPNTTEASCHALHLLCQCYDYKECETLFRDVWPIDDKKMDSVFRRTVAGWLRGIISNHPQFFADVKLEALGFLLVNPWGDRFTQLLECFAELVMSRILRCNPLPKECAEVYYNKPNYLGNNNSSVTSVQILVLIKQTRIFVYNTVNTRVKMIKDELHGQKIAEKVRLHTRSIELEIENASSRIEEIQQEFPELKTNLDYRLGDVSSHWFQRLEMLLNFNPETAVNTTTLQGLDRVLTTQLKAVANVAHTLEILFNKYKSVWYIIGLKTPKQNVLDIGSLFITTPTRKPATFHDFINTLKEITRKFLDDERLKQPVSTELLLKFKQLHFNFDHLKLCWKNINSQRAEILTNYSDCDFHLFRDQTKESCQGVDWSILSKLNVPQLNSALFFTPSKKIELGAKTGYTPRMTNFLEPGTVTEQQGLKGSSEGPQVSNLTAHSQTIIQHTTPPVKDSITRQLQNNTENGSELIVPEKVDLLPVPRLSSSVTPTIVASPVTRFVTNSQKPPLPNIRLSHPVISISSERLQPSPVNPKSNSNSVVLEENNVSDVSMSSDSATPVRIDPSTQARIDRIMSSLSIVPTPNTSRNCSFTSLRNSESFDIKPGGGSSRRSSLAFRSRVSISSNGGGPHQDGHNKSLLENWSDEKGIMDMSMNSNGLWGAVGSSDDES